MEQRLIPAGSQMVEMRLRSCFNEADWAEEQMKGVSYLLFLRGLASAVESDWQGVLAVLEDLRGKLVNAGATIANVTLDEKSWSGCEQQLRAFLDALPHAALPHHAWLPQRSAANEGMTIPAQVNYVGKAANLYQMGYKHHGSVHVITGYLRTTWLWDRVRVHGGAYGARCHFDRFSGVLTFTSYRDPNLLETLDVFDQAAGFLRDKSLSNDERIRSIIGTIADIDMYMLPDNRGYTSVQRLLVNNTDAMRQQLRDEILSTTEEHFKSFAGVLEEMSAQGVVKVIGHQQAIEEAAGQRPGWMELLKVL
jgi:Zn-dependent M16 (insulinase) family peptidase